MTPSDDKRMFRDMQEHPEQYSDHELETLMERIDHEPDTAAAWRRFAQKHPQSKARKRLLTRFAALPTIRKIAAIILAALLLSGLNYAAFSAFHFLLTRDRKVAVAVPAQPHMVAHREATIPADTLYRFNNVQLDSILTLVGLQYERTIFFRDSAARSLRLYTSWHSTQPLEEFVEMMNEFDVFRLTDQGDTLFVERTKPGEDRK